MERIRHLFPRAHTERDDAPRLIPRFAVYAGVALALAAGAGLLFARHNATERAQHQVFSDARFVAERLGRDDLAGSAFKQPVGPDLRAQLDALFGGGLLGPGVLRATLLSPSGVVTYSTDHELIGRAAANTDAVRGALAGAPVRDRGRLNDDGGRGENAEVLVSYVPVRWLLAGSRAPGGVLAVSRDYRPVAKTIRRDVLLQAAVIALALLILYGALFPILRRVTATLAFRHRRLLEQARALRTSEQRYRGLTEQASDGILVRDLDGNYLEANEQACAMVRLLAGGTPAQERPGRDRRRRARSPAAAHRGPPVRRDDPARANLPPRGRLAARGRGARADARGRADPDQPARRVGAAPGGGGDAPSSPPSSARRTTRSWPLRARAPCSAGTRAPSGCTASARPR